MEGEIIPTQKPTEARRMGIYDPITLWVGAQESVSISVRAEQRMRQGSAVTVYVATVQGLPVSAEGHVPRVAVDRLWEEMDRYLNVFRQEQGR